jgi:hypothetical protein
MAQHGPVPRGRPVIAGLLGFTVATVATFAGASGASAASAPTLTVTPGHGPSTAPFTIAYQEPVRLLVGPCPSSVTFTFDGTVLGDAPLTRKGSSCVAGLRASPTPGSGPGPHTVRAPDASVTYTVDPAQGAPPSPVRASPTSGPSAASAGPSDVAGAQPAVPSAADTGQDPPSADIPAGLAGTSGSGTSATTWVLGGAALLIVVVTILALLSLRGRRGEHYPTVEGG